MDDNVTHNRIHCNCAPPINGDQRPSNFRSEHGEFFVIDYLQNGATQRSSIGGYITWAERLGKAMELNIFHDIERTVGRNGVAADLLV